MQKRLKKMIFSISLLMASATLAQVRQEAEFFVSQSGTEVEACSDDGGQQLGFISDGDWSAYSNINFGDDIHGSVQFDLRASCNLDGGTVELRLDSLDNPVIATLDVTNTGSWQDYETFSTSFAGITGTHTLYLRYTGISAYLLNFNWFEWNPPSELRACYEMNENSGSILSDRSGNGNDAAVNSATWVEGIQGSALAFNGSDASVTLPAELFASVSNEVSVAMWVYGAGSQPREDTVLFAGDADGNRVLNLHIPWSDSRVYWDAGNDGEDFDRISLEVADETFKGRWNHWVFTKDSDAGTLCIYLNGELLDMVSGNTRMMDGITSVVLGDKVGGGKSYDGTLDEVWILDVALSASGVDGLYNSYTVTNGVPVGWLTRNGLEPSDDAALTDSSGDGILNWQKYILGCDAMEDGTLMLTNHASGATNSFAWNTEQSRMYNVYWSSNLTHGFTLLQSNAVNGTFSETGQGDAGFYKVNVELEERAWSYNAGPQIKSVASELNLQGELGEERYLITVTATDPNGGDLSYAYEVIDGAGTFSGASGNQVYYSHETGGDHTLRITATDEWGATAVYDYTFTIDSLSSAFYLDEDLWWAAVGDKDNSYYAWVENDPALPNVLLIGDSISGQYTLGTRSRLSGEANVYRIPANGADSGNVLANLEDWFAGMDWDVVHVNAGLHDLKYLLNGNLTDPEDGGIQNVTEQEYKDNLAAIFTFVAASRQVTELIWATTTVVPEGADGRVAGDAVVYNGYASEVLADYPNIAVNDLYTAIYNYPEGWRTANVHFNSSGAALLADEVAAAIRAKLP